MNAPVTIDRVGILMPECTDAEERELRERLLLARDIATRELARKWQHPAAPLLQVMSEIAGQWSLAVADVSQLKQARETCLELMRMIVRVEELADAYDRR